MCHRVKRYTSDLTAAQWQKVQLLLPINREGKICDRSLQAQQYHASGLNLVTMAIVLWNTVYLDLARTVLDEHGIIYAEENLRHLSPIKWEHIRLTGDYVWRPDQVSNLHRLRPPRPLPQRLLRDPPMLLHQALDPVVTLSQALLQPIESRVKTWTRPASDRLIRGAAMDMLKSRSELMAENAFLRQQIILLKRHATPLSAM